MKKYNIKDTKLHNDIYKTAYTLNKDELIKASKVMASAFNDDPSIRYLLGGEKEGNYDWKYFLCVLKAIYDKCVILSSNDNIDNLLILFPPQLEAVPTISFMLNGGLKLFKHFGLSLYFRSISYENNCQKIKNNHTDNNTWYCMCFVVKPNKQNMGLGSRLIKPVLEILEQYGISLYLETHKDVNVDIYKHLGFEIAAISKIPKTEIKQYSLIKR